MSAGYVPDNGCLG